MAGPPRKRARRAERANTRSDLSQRILVAIPAIAYAIFIVWQGGIVFTLGLLPLGIVCLHELYDDVRPRAPGAVRRDARASSG